MTDDRRRDCTCPRTRHKHGTALAYRRDRCRCAPCTRAQNVEQAQYRADKAAGVVALVDATRAREHARALVSLGMTPELIAARTGYAKHTLYQLTSGERARISARLSEAVLAVRIPRAGQTNPHARVARAPVVARVRALVALGWTKPRLAREAGIPLGTLRWLLEGERAPTVATRDAVFIAYERLRALAPIAHSPQEARAIRETIARARREGWKTPRELTDVDLYVPRASRAA